jgi:hypothetical protein
VRRSSGGLSRLSGHPASQTIHKFPPALLPCAWFAHVGIPGSVGLLTVHKSHSPVVSLASSLVLLHAEHLSYTKSIKIFKNCSFRTEGMAQEVEYLSSKHRVPSLNPSTAKKQYCSFPIPTKFSQVTEPSHIIKTEDFSRPWLTSVWPHTHLSVNVLIPAASHSQSFFPLKVQIYLVIFPLSFKNPMGSSYYLCLYLLWKIHI